MSRTSRKRTEIEKEIKKIMKNQDIETRIVIHLAYQTNLLLDIRDLLEEANDKGEPKLILDRKDLQV